MTQEELKIILEALIQFTIATSIIIVLAILILKLSRVFFLFIRKRVIKMRLRQYPLEDYNIFVDINGLPTTLIDKKTNKVIFL